jgi:4-hydroxybenzoyl-CoA thioesterase
VAPFRVQIPVRFADVDHAGIVYYPVFYHYFHVAFEELFRQRMGAGAYVELLDRRRIGFPAVETRCRYLSPLRFGDEVTVELAVRELGHRSMTFAYRAVRAADEVLSAEGEVVCAIVDLERFRAVPLPDDLRRFFLEFSERGRVKPDQT